MNKTHKPLTAHIQQKTLRKLLVVHDAILRYREKNMDSPSMQNLIEMVDEVGKPLIATSPSVIQRYFRQMEELGMVRLKPRQFRSVYPLDLDQADPRVVEMMKNIEKEKG